MTETKYASAAGYLIGGVREIAIALGEGRLDAKNAAELLLKTVREAEAIVGKR